MQELAKRGVQLVGHCFDGDPRMRSVALSHSW